LMYKLPGGGISAGPLRVVGHDEGNDVAQASADLRFAAAVAGFGLLLRDSAYRGTLTYDAVFGLAAGALGDDPDGRRARFIELVRAAKKLAEKTVTAE
jgi:Ca-activated chloride channel homolog